MRSDRCKRELPGVIDFSLRTHGASPTRAISGMAPLNSRISRPHAFRTLSTTRPIVPSCPVHDAHAVGSRSSRTGASSPDHSSRSEEQTVLWRYGPTCGSTATRSEASSSHGTPSSTTILCRTDSSSWASVPIARHRPALDSAAPHRELCVEPDRSPRAMPMRLRTFCIVAICLTAATRSGAAQSNQAPNVLTDAEQREGWQLLFDGRALTGWHALGFRYMPSWLLTVED